GPPCPACGGILATRYEPTDAPAWDAASRLPGIRRYAPLLPVHDAARAVTLGEGRTPLVRGERLAASLGLANLRFKVEAANPTGSFKDRIAAVAITRPREARRGGLDRPLVGQRGRGARRLRGAGRDTRHPRC